MTVEPQQLVRVVNINDHQPGNYNNVDDGVHIPYWRIWNVTRPNIFGNPFPLRNSEDSEERVHVLMLFAEYWYDEKQRPLRNRAMINFLPGTVLGCVCKPKECHADIIAGYLNWRRNGFREIERTGYGY